MRHNLKSSKLIFFTEKISRYFFLVFLILFNINSGYSQIVRTEISDVIKKSDFITRAQVVSTSSEWKSDSRGKHIYTICKMKTLENYKGNNGEYFTVELVGGTVGDMTETVIPSIKLYKDEEVILSMEGQNLEINDLTYGKIPVINDQVFFEKERINVKYFAKAINDVISNPFKYTITNDFIDKINSFKKSVDSTAISHSELKFQVISIDKGTNSIIKKGITSGPNLTFIQPSDWSEKVILSNRANTYKSDTIYKSNTLYIDCCVGNTGDTLANSFYINYYLDTVFQDRETVSNGLLNGTSIIIPDIYITEMKEGIHILRIVLDIQDKIKESNEYDNEIFITFQVYKTPSGTSPKISNVTPSSASAGTNSQVTISGSNFGSFSGNNTVYFFYASNLPKILASIISWSDNKIICTVPGLDDYGASSGPMYITGNNLISNSIDFNVTFGYLGYKWNLNPIVVKYKINENLPGINNVANEIITAANSWGLKRSNFRLQYDGATNALTTSIDNINEILFQPSAQSYIGITFYYTKNNYLTETDISFNTRLIFGTNLESNKYDLRTVAVHELGHVVGLQDLYGNTDTYKTMYGFGSPGLIKRTISPADSAGLFWIYGSREFAKYKISGEILSKTTPLSNVLVTLSGEKDSTVLTGENGEYSFIVDSSFDYTITPSKDGYLFIPSSKTFTGITGNQSQDFSAVQLTATNIISGIITYNGSPLSNVMVHLSGDTNETVLTGLSGKYSIKTALNGSYTVTPYKTGYYFLPNSKTFSKVVADQTQDFSASVTNISQAPVLVSPAKDSYGNVNTISFSWNAISNVSGYELQLSTDNTFNNIILDNINYYNLVQTINNLAPNTLFYWRIRGLKGDDQGNWSEVWNFRTAASELSKPVITYPSYNLTNVSINPKLKWTAMEGASSYDVMISDKQDMSNIIVLYQFLELPSVNVKNLENNKTYYWKALSRKELATSEWTLPYKFTTIDAGVGVANTEELPESFSLSQNYPNPFNPSTTIQYSIIEPAFVTIKIFDIYGREVETLVNKNLPAGRYSTTWEPRKITSGVYYYKIAAGKYNEIRKMVYLR